MPIPSDVKMTSFSRSPNRVIKALMAVLVREYGVSQEDDVLKMLDGLSRKDPVDASAEMKRWVRHRRAAMTKLAHEDEARSR